MADPPGEVTTTDAAPIVPIGVIAVIWVGELTVNEAAFTPPKVTAVTPVKLLPVIITVVPPTLLPVFGDIDVKVGGAK